MKKTKLECDKIGLHLLTSKGKKILRRVSSLEQNLKWNILFLSQYQDLYFISTFSTISKFPCYHFIFNTRRYDTYLVLTLPGFLHPPN